MTIRIPLSLFLNTGGKSIKRIAHNQLLVASKMKGSFVAFFAIFLMISLEMMGGVEGKPEPEPQPEPHGPPGGWPDSVLKRWQEEKKKNQEDPLRFLV